MKAVVKEKLHVAAETVSLQGSLDTLQVLDQALL